MSSLRTTIRQYLGAELAAGNDIVRGAAADQFIADHPDEVAEHAAALIKRAVDSEIKALCNERPEDTGQVALFPGLPAAIVVADGVARPLNHCTWADLMVGRVERVENIAHAEKALERYDKDLDRVRPHLEPHPERTVADVRLALSGGRS